MFQSWMKFQSEMMWLDWESKRTRNLAHGLLETVGNNVAKLTEVEKMPSVVKEYMLQEN